MKKEEWDFDEAIKYVINEEFKNIEELMEKKEETWDKIQEELSEKKTNNRYLKMIVPVAAALLLFIASFWNTDSPIQQEMQKNKVENTKSADPKYKKPDYIPEQIEFDRIEEESGVITQYYKHKIYSETTENKTTEKKTVIKEYHNKTPFDLKDMKKENNYYVKETNGIIHIIWENNGVNFEIISSLKKEEVVKIMESIKKDD